MPDHYLDKVLAGDPEAYRYFLRTYKDMAFTVAVSIVKDDQYAEEVVQDAFMKAFKGLKSFKRTSTFRSWFYRIVVNESFQRLKKIKRQLPTLDLAELQESWGAETLTNESEKMERVHIALRALHPKESLALNLYYLEDYSVKEIAEITGWTQSNSKVLLHRGRKNIRKLLGSTFKAKQ